MLHTFPHAIMFHHFHNNKHPLAQGSINAKTFSAMIKWLKNKYNLLSAPDFYKKATNNNLDKLDICLSFDDALLCQYDIAFPILEKENIKAFFFIYSAPLIGKIEHLEVFRYFRCVSYSSIEMFYNDFFKIIKQNFRKIYEKGIISFNKKKFLKDYNFYSEQDKWFRYLRDYVLNKKEYEDIMYKLMEEKKFNLKNIIKQLWMSENQIKNLNNSGHIIGLHSYNHPTMINKLNKKKQELEYISNKKHLEAIIYPQTINSMSHPCGRYNTTTLNILKSININIGFKSNSIVNLKKNSLLEIPREDHSNILNYMKT